MDVKVGFEVLEKPRARHALTRFTGLVVCLAIAKASAGCIATTCNDEGGCATEVRVKLQNFAPDADSTARICEGSTCVDLSSDCSPVDTARFSAGWCEVSESASEISVFPKFDVKDGDDYSLTLRSAADEELLDVVFSAEYEHFENADSCEACIVAEVTFQGPPVNG